MRLTTARIVNMNARHEHDNIIIIIETFIVILFYCSAQCCDSEQPSASAQLLREDRRFVNTLNTRGN